MDALGQQIVANNPGICLTDLQDAITFHANHPGVARPFGDAGGIFMAEDAPNQSVKTGGGEGGVESPQGGDFPESFRCILDPETGSYKVQNPIVVTPYGEIEATVGGRLGPGRWYCRVSLEDHEYSAEITQDNQADKHTIVIVPLFDITNDEIFQKHIGTIIVAAIETEFVSGEDSNVVFREVDEDDDGDEDSHRNKRTVKVDVYYC